MKDFFVWLIYNILFAVVYTLMMPKFLLRMKRRGGYRADFRQRFGRYDDDVLKRLRERPRIWVHAVSVGEVFLALRFIAALREAMPEYAFVLSTTTSTGHAQAKSSLHMDDVLIYYPMDLPHIVRRVVHQINPLALVLMECELWPNMLRMLKNRNVPVFVVNGRISDGSYRGYRKVRFFFQRAVAWIDCLMVQSAVDEQRLLDLGALPEQLVVTGSAKYDTAVPDGSEKETAENVLAEAGMNHRGALLVAGSTWPGEEKALLEIFEALRLNQPDLQLILVPRHMERRAEVEALLRASGLSYIKRTDMTGSDTAGDDRVPPLVLLADTTGELKNYYSIATLVFVGKSLGDNRGGQNPIEPAMFGKAVVVGPHMENFPGVMDDFLAAKALVQVTDELELRQRMAELLEKQELRSGYGSRAAELVASKRGAVARSVALIKQIVSESEQGRCA